MNNSTYSMPTNAVALRHATGKMRFNLTNDYLFRATLQKNRNALKGLISSILSLNPEEITSVEVTNPIELGKSMEAKDFLLDVRVLLNSHTTINLEMQILNLDNWPERSLTYLCRSFDQLNSGQDYVEVRPVIQVCFLDFTLFKEFPEFFSTYMFINIKSHVVYSDKLKLLVIDLTQTNIATEEDKAQGIDCWAKLFKATTWEEVKMLAMKNSYLEEAAETTYQLTAEEMVRLQCEAREDFYRQQRYIQKKLDRLELLENRISEKEALLIEKDASLAEKDASLAEKDASLAEKDASLAEKDAALTALKDELARLKEENERLRKSQ